MVNECTEVKNYTPGRGKIVSRNVNNVNNLAACRKGLQTF